MILLALAAAASAPSFDCAKATTAVEKMICADPELAAADRAMAKLYAAAPRSDPMTGQKSFLADRSECSDRACLLQVYEDRLGTLFPASRLKGRQYASKANNGVLSVLSLGGDWYAFHAMGLWFGPNDGQVNDAITTGVFKLVGGRASRAPADLTDCGWRIRREPGDRWYIRDWPGSEDAACGGVNATIEGEYSR
jgi:hypothetical protein